MAKYGEWLYGGVDSLDNENSRVVQFYDEYITEDPNEWPGPPRHTLTEAKGQLKSDICARLGVDPEAVNVQLRETEQDAGYSEYTAWTEYDLDVLVDNEVVKSWRDNENVIKALVNWIEEDV
jgi:hypothetical protein